MKHKYPRTYHFDFSLDVSSDDKILSNIDNFIGKEVIVTEKMDGENSNIYCDYFHPRSITDDGHPSRSWLKGYIAIFQYKIPKGWRICGENLYAKHSIYYTELENYFYAFSIWNDENFCLSWDHTVEFCEQLNITTVPVLYRGQFDYELIKELFLNQDHNQHEGIVCRLADSFHYNDFAISVAKAVRKDHVRSSEHWKNNWIKNKLKNEK